MGTSSTRRDRTSRRFSNSRTSTPRGPARTRFNRSTTASGPGAGPGGALAGGRPVIDVPRALRVATDTGEVRFGLREVRRAAKSKKAKLVVLASNCPAEAARHLGDIRVFRFGGTNVDLGAACGVPFSVAAVAVISPGESNILTV